MATVEIKSNAVKQQPVYISLDKKEDYKAIKLVGDDTVYVEPLILANNLINAKKAVEAKGVDFSIDNGHIVIIEDNVKK